MLVTSGFRKRKHKDQEEVGSHSSDVQSDSPERVNEIHLERMNGINEIDGSTNMKSTKMKKKKEKSNHRTK